MGGAVTKEPRLAASPAAGPARPGSAPETVVKAPPRPNFFNFGARAEDKGLGKAALVSQLKRPSLLPINWSDKKAMQGAMVDILASPEDLCDFTKFMCERFAEENLNFCCEAEAYRKRCLLRSSSDRALKDQAAEARAIQVKFVGASAPQQVPLTNRALKTLTQEMKLKPSATVFCAAKAEVLAQMTADVLHVFTEKQKRRKSLSGAAQLLASNAELRRLVKRMSAVRHQEHAATLARRKSDDAAKAARESERARAPPRASVVPAAPRRKSNDDVVTLGASGDLSEGALAEAVARTVARCSAAGHERWRAAWAVDVRNPSGAEPRMKHGENINVPFSQLKNSENTSENYRAAELAISLALRPDLGREGQLGIIHKEWLLANADDGASDGPLSALEEAQHAEKRAAWLDAAAAALRDVQAALDDGPRRAAAVGGVVRAGAAERAREVAVDIAVVVVAAAGHRRWCDLWRGDSENNPTGDAPFMRHGQNLDVGFEALNELNRSADLETARLAVRCAVRGDVTEDQRLQLLEDARRARDGEAADGTATPRARAMNSAWLVAARQALLIPRVERDSLDESPRARVHPRADGRPPVDPKGGA